MHWLFTWISLSLSLYVTALIVPGFKLRSFGSSLVAVVVIGFLNLFIRPLLFYLTLPLTILTLGFFTFVLNAIILRIAAGLLKGFDINGWFSALIGALILSLVQSFTFIIFGY